MRRSSSDLGQGAIERTIYSSVGQLADELLSGRKGLAFTELMIFMDLTDNPAALRQIYQQNAQAIDQYMEKIELSRVLADLQTGAAGEEGGIGAATTAFAGGVGFTALLSVLVNRMQS